MTVKIIEGDCLAVLPTLAENSVECVVTDPPYHLTSEVPHVGRNGFNRTREGIGQAARTGFMSQTWDGGRVAFEPETWAAVLRVLKPGGFMVAFASTRGYHRMVCAVEDAGFVIHPMIGWIFGTGFPKATRFKQPDLKGWRYGLQALKPALEPICLAQKPLEGTGSANWDAHGCGGLNIDGCRVGSESTKRNSSAETNGVGWGMGKTAHVNGCDAGRYPANLVLSPSEDEYILRSDVTLDQRRELYGWLQANA